MGSLTAFGPAGLLLLAAAGLAGCGTPDEPPVRLPAAVTISHPEDGRPEDAVDAQAEGLCRQWGRAASVVERYRNESRDSKVSAYNCVAG
ncbi:hypothetical protein JL101_002355 [Skermanella rosea]|uniref:hypothetical protein n=1 Tax=Skermanella rosea TaxID=1817965 RepID=UPI0019334C68|nr:hypothetical protein [Skermanella rosea]UEM04309.1 hypothetical protein JL101_002355 [Skermanella rosea]